MANKFRLLLYPILLLELKLFVFRLLLLFIYPWLLKAKNLPFGLLDETNPANNPYVPIEFPNSKLLLLLLIKPKLLFKFPNIILLLFAPIPNPLHGYEGFGEALTPKFEDECFVINKGYYCWLYKLYWVLYVYYYY